MKYDEALLLKSTKSTGGFLQDGIYLKVYVTPALEQDMERYLTEVNGKELSDELAKKYSSNNKFKLRGVWTDGMHVLYKDFN